MAHITINKTTQGTVATIAGTVTSSTAKILNNYIERNKLDVQSTIVKPFGVQLSNQNK